MCGVIAILGEKPSAETLYHGMVQLQHRGQDAAGMFTFDPGSGNGQLKKGVGLVSSTFTPQCLSSMKGSWGVGHVRYNTVGKGGVQDAQPLLLRRGELSVALAYNGNVVNYLPLKEEMMQRGGSFQTTSDAEVILQLFAEGLSQKECSFPHLSEAVSYLFERLSGAYSAVLLIEGVGMAAFRDPAGIRPLLFARSTDGRGCAVVSESSALSHLDYCEPTPLEPGELLFVDKTLRTFRKRLKVQQRACCSFEFNYFAKPNAVAEGREIYRIRTSLGRALAAKARLQGLAVDAVVPIPNTARPAAIAMARELSLPLEEGFVKQEHMGRTFIMPTQKGRDRAILQKLSAVRSVFEGKEVVLVDDSIVRGSVSKKVIRLARQAGAKSVSFASTFPPIRFPCLYGIDFASQEELLAREKSPREICEEIGADALIYNDSFDLKRAIGMAGICTACLDGNYPTEIEGMEALSALRGLDLETMEKALI